MSTTVTENFFYTFYEEVVRQCIYLRHLSIKARAKRLHQLMAQLPCCKHANQYLLCLVIVLGISECVVATATTTLQSSRPIIWQEGVLCRSSNKRIRTCTQIDHQSHLKTYQDALANSKSWPVMASDHQAAAAPSTPRFVILSRLLQPKEANIQFAQAFCVSVGGRLAFWNNAQEYAAVVRLVRAYAATQQGGPVYVFVGAVQLPGSKRAQDGWVWLHKPYRVSTSFPWAAGEPNDHNEGKQQGHSEDCAVLATYHKAAENQGMVDDFPCNYATPEGKFMFNGHNPRLTVACRL